MSQEYDPANRHDPLRHDYFARKVHSTFEIPAMVKVANGLGVKSAPAKFVPAKSVYPYAATTSTATTATVAVVPNGVPRSAEGPVAFLNRLLGRKP